jgi:hypothetical protein
LPFLRVRCAQFSHKTGKAFCAAERNVRRKTPYLSTQAKTPSSMPDYSKINPEHFFSCQSEKTKFNWFAFELACEIDRAIPNKLKQYLSKRGYTKESFNKSCIKLANLLQGVVLKKLNNEIPDMQLNYTEVEKAFPTLNDKTIDKLLTCTENAWENLLKICSCPSACISNKDDFCPMFDDKWYYSE